MDLRDAALSLLPHGLVQRQRKRRLLHRLGAADLRPAGALLAVECRLDLLPPGALGAVETVVDIGANEGRWSVSVLALARPRHLIAVEPSPEVLPLLRQALSGHSQAEVIEAAIGATSGDLTFNITSHSHNASVLLPKTTEMNRIYGMGYDLVRQITVPLLTLDDVTARLPTVSLLKIDVQGFENSVLAGGSETLGKTKWVLIEANFRSHYHGDMLFPDLHAVLTGKGFQLSGMSPPSIRAGMAMWADALYERSDVLEQSRTVGPLGRNRSVIAHDAR